MPRAPDDIDIGRIWEGEKNGDRVRLWSKEK